MLKRNDKFDQWFIDNENQILELIDCDFIDMDSGTQLREVARIMWFLLKEQNADSAG
jgi:hypothetical protein